jgi:ankyrin repeat protein
MWYSRKNIFVVKTLQFTKEVEPRGTLLIAIKGENTMKTLTSILLTIVFLLTPAATQAQEIFDAVKSNDLAKAKALIEKDVSLTNVKDDVNNTPLHYAAEKGYLTLVEFLVSKSADINSANNRLNTPLNMAILNGKDNVSEYLIEHGSDLRHQNIMGYSPLHLSARHNRVATAGLLIARGVDLDRRDKNDRTPLNYLTLMTDNIEAARLLIKSGADINAKDSSGMMPLNHAVHGNSPGLIDLLLDNGADINTTPAGGPITWVRMAASIGSARMFNVLVEKVGEDLFKKESDGESIMRSAISGGSFEIVKMLLAKNIPIDMEANIYGWTPLHYAANKGSLELIKLLAEKGVDIDRRTNNGKSAYNIAEEKGHKEALSLITKLGGSTEPQKFPILKGPYLGQTPPEDKPERFAPGIVSAGHSSISTSPDGQEMYWGSGASIYFTKVQNGHWTQPEVVSFSGTSHIEMYDDVPFVSPDNRKLFFTSLRPIGSGTGNKENIWFVERTPTGWSDPQPASPKVNALQLHWQISVSSSGTLYFGGQREDGFGETDIFYSRLENGEYTTPVNIGPIINSENGETCPFISPDESYLLFTRIVNRRSDGFYISFKGKEGQWLEPKKLQQLPPDICPIISPDGKYLFTMGGMWVSASFIEELRPKE